MEAQLHYLTQLTRLVLKGHVHAVDHVYFNHQIGELMPGEGRLVTAAQGLLAAFG